MCFCVGLLSYLTFNWHMDGQDFYKILYKCSTITILELKFKDCAFTRDFIWLHIQALHSTNSLQQGQDPIWAPLLFHFDAIGKSSIRIDQTQSTKFDVMRIKASKLLLKCRRTTNLFSIQSYHTTRHINNIKIVHCLVWERQRGHGQMQNLLISNPHLWDSKNIAFL